VRGAASSIVRSLVGFLPIWSVAPEDESGIADGAVVGAEGGGWL
jgi:hypothetical protein